MNGQMSRKEPGLRPKTCHAQPQPVTGSAVSVLLTGAGIHSLKTNKQHVRAGEWKEEPPECQDLTSASGGTADQRQVKETLPGQARRVPVNLSPGLPGTGDSLIYE